jgi:ABC-type branched-subunit amino acid transport system substrate-binding protein
MVASFSGSNKDRGRAMRAGWLTAFAAANDAGGVNGRALRLVARDDGYDPKRTGPMMQELVEKEKVFAIVGNVGTSTAGVAIPYCAEKGLVFYGALSGGDLLRKTPPDRHVFNFRASLAEETEAAIRYLVAVRRVKPSRIAVLVQDDDFGASGFRGAASQLGAYRVPEEKITRLTYPRNTVDVSAAVEVLKQRASQFDAVTMVATYKPAAAFIRRTKDAGLNLIHTVVSADSNGLADELAPLGPRFTENVVVTQVVPLPTSGATAMIKYRQALAKYTPDEKPGSTSLEAWLGAQVFIEGLKRAGPDLTSDKLIAALESIDEMDVGIAETMRFGPNDHQASNKVWGWLLQPDGLYKQVELD